MGFFGGGKAKDNPRCAVSLKEATDFLARLKRAEKELRTLHKTADATLAGCKEVMNSPLPHVYEETASASGGGVKAMESIGGPGFSAEQVSRFSVEMGQAMESQVFAPLNQWISNHTDAVNKQKGVDKLWAEVTTRRSKVDDLRKKVDQLRAKQGDPKGAAKLEEATKTLQHKEAKLTIAESRYAEEEEQQYNRLCVLIKDAVYLRVFIKTALAQVASALSSASESMLIFLPDQQGPVAAPQAPVQQVPQQQMLPPQPPQAGMAHATTMPSHHQQQLAAEYNNNMTLGGPQPGLGHAMTMGPGQPAAGMQQGAATWGPGGSGAGGAPVGGVQRGTSAGSDAGAAAYGKTFGRTRTMSGAAQ